MFFTPIFIVFTLFLLANTQTTTKSITTTHITTLYKTTTHKTTTTHTATRDFRPIVAIPPNFMAAVIQNDALSEYLATATIQPEYTAAKKALASALPDDLYYRWQTYSMSPFDLWPMAGEEPSWMSAMPASDVSYYSSFLAKEYSIMTGTVTVEGSAPTNRPRVEVVGAALAVGAAGLAML